VRKPKKGFHLFSLAAVDRHVQHELHNKIKSVKMSITITTVYPDKVKQRDSQFSCHPTGGATCTNCTAAWGEKAQCI